MAMRLLLVISRSRSLRFRRASSASACSKVETPEVSEVGERNAASLAVAPCEPKLPRLRGTGVRDVGEVAPGDNGADEGATLCMDKG